MDRREEGKIFRVKPIGYVRKDRIVVDPRWTKGLAGLEGFSHILAFFWLHRAHKTDLQIHPKGPGKFFPIGFTVLRLVKRKGRVLWVEGLDVRDGTPLIDLKPYTQREEVKGRWVPPWVKKLDALETDPLRKYDSE
jgi:tRNA (Thr-GGU) A37 N-methylase